MRHLHSVPNLGKKQRRPAVSAKQTGYTMIPNVIFEEILPQLKPNAAKLLFIICRQTYGYHKQSDQISLRELSDMTGIRDRGNVCRGIQELSKVMGDLLTIKPGDWAKNASREYRLNIAIRREDEVLSEIQHPVVRGVVRGVVRTPPIKRNQRNQRKEYIHASRVRVSFRPEDFDRFYEAYPRHVGKAEALKAWTRLSPTPDLVTEIMAGVGRYAQSVAGFEQRYIKHPASWLIERRWEDEPVRKRRHDYEAGAFPPLS